MCVNVPSECSRCQALTTRAPEIVYMCPPANECQGVFSYNSQFRQIKAVSRAFQIVAGIYTLEIEHTHAHTNAVVCSGCQCGLQPIITP